MLIAICEDDAYYSNGLAEMCRQWEELHSDVPLSIHQYSTPESILNGHEHPLDYDLYFLDIGFGSLSSMNGYRLATLIRENNSESMIVFITNSRNYLLQGYNVSAYRYLIKPLNNSDVSDCLNHCRDEVLRFSNSTLSLDKKEGVSRIRLKDILYIESGLHSIIVHTVTKAESAHIYQSFDSYVQTLPAEWFVRCQRGLLINPSYICKYSKRSITLSSGENFTIGAKYRDQLCERLRIYFIGGLHDSI